jgi:Ca2+-binding EF-hand superfamily protein
MRAIIDVADRNGDGRMTREELVEYLDLVASAALAQVSISLTSSGQGLFEALDTNGDGYLGVREMRNAWQRLSMFDADGDMAVSKAELPTQVRLTVGRGGSNARGMTPEGEVVEAGRAVPTRGPLWFRKMDRNGDGDVSRAEWLGNPEDFDRADTNKDGLLSLEEAEALDANLRK